MLTFLFQSSGSCGLEFYFRQKAACAHRHTNLHGVFVATELDSCSCGKFHLKSVFHPLGTTTCENAVSNASHNAAFQCHCTPTHCTDPLLRRHELQTGRQRFRWQHVPGPDTGSTCSSTCVVRRGHHVSHRVSCDSPDAAEPPVHLVQEPVVLKQPTTTHREQSLSFLASNDHS